jgi:hypothetical protein
MTACGLFHHRRLMECGSLFPLSPSGVLRSARRHESQRVAGFGVPVGVSVGKGLPTYSKVPRRRMCRDQPDSGEARAGGLLGGRGCGPSAARDGRRRAPMDGSSVPAPPAPQKAGTPSKKSGHFRAREPPISSLGDCVVGVGGDLVGVPGAAARAPRSVAATPSSRTPDRLPGRTRRRRHPGIRPLPTGGCPSPVSGSARRSGSR